MNTTLPRIIAVLDLLGGRVVHAVGGRRSEYLPIYQEDGSPHTAASRVCEIVRRTGLREFYVADLDAIDGGPVDRDALLAVASQAASLWVDVGINGQPRSRKMCQFAASTSTDMVNIIGLESLSTPDDLAGIVGVLGQQRTAFSLDLRDGNTITNYAPWRSCDILEIVRVVALAGVTRLIVLDLAAVGSRTGCPTAGLCRRIRDEFPGLELVAGGGVRDAEDLKSLADVGCDGVLVGTSIMACGG